MSADAEQCTLVCHGVDGGSMTLKKKEKDKVVRFNICLPPKLAERLDVYCADNHNVQRSRVIQDVVAEFLDREDKKSKR